MDKTEKNVTVTAGFFVVLFLLIGIFTTESKFYIAFVPVILFAYIPWILIRKAKKKIQN